MTKWHIPFELDFEDLHKRSGLEKLDIQFLRFLRERSEDIHARLVRARLKVMQLERPLPKSEESRLLIDLAPYLEDFLAEFFAVQKNVAALAERVDGLAPVYRVKRNFVQRVALRKYHDVSAFDGDALLAELEKTMEETFSETAFAQHIEKWEQREEHEKLDLAARYAAWASHTAEGYKRHIRGVLFKHPKKVDPDHLVPLETQFINGIAALKEPGDNLRARQAFELTDAGCDLSFALDQMHYCIKCHEREKDSCSTGLKEKDTDKFIRNSLENDLVGCPLEQKISEMHVLAERGQFIGALAVVCVDNPMVAATGHRICNDCMKSCIFQKQDPVDIPQAETRILKEVLAFPRGFEIYSLLTRWNPLNLSRPLPKPLTGKNVLVVGMGPAGFTLAHHLIQDGHTVVGIDGLKIEPHQTPFAPVEDVRNLYESLDDRVMAGFGGVAEYGITVRWDKNFLKLIRLLLERRESFRLYGGVRFGGTIGLDQAFDALGFDHIALCTGAGRPTILDIPNGLARGVRAASDFLMALQLTGAARKDSLANLQIRLPVVVIGGGLTAVDTATESLAYYPRQVEKFAARYQALVRVHGKAVVEADWTDEDREIAQEFLQHAAALSGKNPLEQVKLIRQWGGVSVVYRRNIQESPSYRLNHEEVDKAFEEGIYFIENMNPAAVEVDSRGAAKALQTIDDNGQSHHLPARTILVAAGTQPNTVIGREAPDKIEIEGRFFKVYDLEGHPVIPERLAKPKDVYLVNYKRSDGRAVTYFGDLHPSFHGKVVKAMGSAKQGYPIVSHLLAQVQSHETGEDVLERLDGLLKTQIVSCRALNSRTTELVIRAPLAAKNYQPGQFFRLQNYEYLAPVIEGTRLQMEGVAVTAVAIDAAAGLITCHIRKTGGSADLVEFLKPGDPVILMGPTGTGFALPENQTLLFIAGPQGHLPLLSLGAAAKARGNRVIYAADRSDQTSPDISAKIQMFAAEIHALEHEDKVQAALQSADQVIVMGNDVFLRDMQQRLSGPWASSQKTGQQVYAGIHAPMQCMMKEVCAQCIQHVFNPETGERQVIFACFNPIQPLEMVNLEILGQRLAQNSLSEKLTRQWLAYLLSRKEKEAA